MRRSVKIALFALGAWCAAGAATPLLAQLRPLSQELRDSLDNPPTAAGSAAMRFAESSIDAGRIGEDDTPPSYRFTWRNAGDKPLVVTHVRTTCGCAAPTWSREPVRPGEEGSLTITYHPKGHPGAFRRKIFVFTQLSDKQPTAVLELTGHVTPSVLPTSAYPYAMGGLLLKQRSVRIEGYRIQTERIECLNAGKTPLRITADSRLLPAYIAFECDPATVEPGRNCDLVIRFDPARAPERLPEQVPVILEGIDLPQSQRTIRVRIGETK